MPGLRDPARSTWVPSVPPGHAHTSKCISAELGYLEPLFSSSGVPGALGECSEELGPCCSLRVTGENEGQGPRKADPN